MKSLLKQTFAILLISSTFSGLQCAQSHNINALHTANKATSQANATQYAGQNYYTLFVMQPTPGYRTLNSCVDYLVSNKKLPSRFAKIAQNDWHISTIAIAVPFDNAPNAAEVAQAAEDLRQIVRKYKADLAKVAYSFSKISSIGNHKFIAAHYDFSAGRIEFLKSYAKIFRDFTTQYPKAYMYYGYKAIPHISVASASGAGNPVSNINTSQCNRVNNVALLHRGRNIHIATGFYNPQSRRIERNTTRAI